jgi:hypothetical protein
LSQVEIVRKYQSLNEQIKELQNRIVRRKSAGAKRCAETYGKMRVAIMQRDQLAAQMQGICF